MLNARGAEGEAAGATHSMVPGKRGWPPMSVFHFLISSEDIILNVSELVMVSPELYRRSTSERVGGDQIAEVRPAVAG